MKLKVMSFITALLLAVLLLMTSCGDDGNPVDNTNPNIETLTTNIAFVGQAIIIKGTKFGTVQGGNYVSLNGAKLNDTSHYTWSDTRIVIIIPSGAVTGGVTVSADGKTSNSVNLTINALPDSTSPFIEYLSQDIAQPRQTISIHGRNFSDYPKGSVEFNGIKAEISTWSSSKITVQVPEDARTGKIVIFTYDDTGTNTAEFRVQNPNPIVDLVRVEPGTFVMGADDEDAPLYRYGPAHNVQITKAFYMAIYEVTQKQYEKVMNGSNPSRIKNDSMPVDFVDWIDAVTFCNSLSKMENYEPCYTINGNDVTCNFDATGYRLPTEAEWEYACRAGDATKYGGQVDDVAWTNRNALDKAPHASGTRDMNAWGIYDMHGNVWEWCWDLYDELFYETRPNPDVDPKGPATSDFSFRVIRGGSYLDGPQFATSSARDGASNTSGNFNLGFRVVRKTKN